MSPQKFGGVSGGMAVVGGEKRGKKRGVSDLGRWLLWSGGGEWMI